MDKPVFETCGMLLPLGSMNCIDICVEWGVIKKARPKPVIEDFDGLWVNGNESQVQHWMSD